MNADKKVAVVTPTYNERKNMGPLVEGIFALHIPHMTLLVVDDSSPDGTAQTTEELAKSYPITVLKRKEKAGLGPAYIEAFTHLLSLPAEEQPDIIIQMDADLSHNPTVIPRMLEAIEQYDLVLGSRYIRSGNIENWSFLRKLISRLGNIYANIVLWIPYRDLTGGFKCWRRETLEAIGLESLSSIGYNFQIEMTYRAHQKGLAIREIPIIFTERTMGKSKFNLGIMLESFWKVLKLRLGK